MDREKIEQEIDRLADLLSKKDPLSDEYKKIRQELENLCDLLLKDEAAEEDRIDKSMNRDLREQELEERRNDSKRKAKSTIWAACLGVLGTIIAGACALIGQRDLRETKEEQGVIDRDEFSIVRGMYPRE